MVSGISQNVGFQGINTATNAAPYMAAPYQYTAQQPAGDVVEIAGKKKSSTAKKGIIGTLVGVAVAAAALYAGVKSGKLTEVANATKWTDKLQNLAFKGGSYVDQGVKYVTQKGGDLVNWAKGKLGKGGVDANGNVTFPAIDSKTGQYYIQFPQA